MRSVIAVGAVALVAGQSPPLEKVCYGYSTLHEHIKSTGQAVVYNGSVNTTVSGLNCLPWAAEAGSNQEDHSHVLNEHHNFCRGVDTRSGRPWCYVDLEDSQLSERHVGVRRGWDWCVVPHCHHYATECQEKLRRFEHAQAEVEKATSVDVVNEFCRPNCDSNGDFEPLQTCAENYMDSTEQTGRCVQWNNNEHPDLVYNAEKNECEAHTKCRYERWSGKNVECDENGIEIIERIIIDTVLTTPAATTETFVSPTMGPPTTAATEPLPAETPLKTEPSPLTTEASPEEEGIVTIIETVTEPSPEEEGIVVINEFATEPAPVEEELVVIDELEPAPVEKEEAAEPPSRSGPSIFLKSLPAVESPFVDGVSGESEISGSSEGSGEPEVAALSETVVTSEPSSTQKLETYSIGESTCKMLPLPEVCDSVKQVELDLFNTIPGFGDECMNLCVDECCPQGQYCVPSKGVCEHE